MTSDDYANLICRMKQFWRPGDEIICTRIFRRSNNDCYLCGHSPIEWHHVLLNSISDETIDVEFSCVINMKRILEEWGSDQKILFFKKYTEEANHLNSQYEGTAEILEFNSNTDVIIQLLSKPNDLSYKQIKSIMDHTSKFKEGIETELFQVALDIYVDRKYYIYERLDDREKTGNIELSIANHIQQEWESLQAEEDEYQWASYNKSSYDPSEESDDR